MILLWKKGQASALDTSRLAAGRDIGNIIVQTINGRKPVDMTYDVTFALVAHAFHPEIKIIRK